MTEKKKAARKSPAAAKKRKNASGDDALKIAVLERALEHAAKNGFSEALLVKAGKEAGAEKEALARLFPDGSLSLIAEFSTRTDTEMQKRLAKMDLPKLKIRERIAAAVKTRLAVLRPHKDAARRAVAMLTLPMHAPLGVKLLYNSVDAMWRTAGDDSTDFNFYTKRGILAGVYSATLLRWFNDKTRDEKATDEFLAARIENVMQFEKFKAEVKKSVAGMPSLGELLRGVKKKSPSA